VKAFSYRRVKNDEKDAADLADLLRMGRLPEAWIAPPEIRELREITRYRCKLVGIRTSGKDQVHGVLAKPGVQVTCSDIFGGWGSAWLDELALPQPYAGKVASLRSLITTLTAEITMLEQVTADLLKHHDGYRAIQALPGIGPVLGAIIVAEIGDISRFAGPARLCCWAGLTPKHHESDTKVVRGRITKQGSRGAALGAGRGDPAGPARNADARGQGRHPHPPRRPGAQHRQGRRGTQAAHLRLLRDARRAGPVPGRPRRSEAGGVSRPGRGQRAIASLSGPRPPAARPSS
jgi:transposase